MRFVFLFLLIACRDPAKPTARHRRITVQMIDGHQCVVNLKSERMVCAPLPGVQLAPR